MGFVDGDSMVEFEYSFEVVTVVGSESLGERVDVVSFGEDLEGFGFCGLASELKNGLGAGVVWVIWRRNECQPVYYSKSLQV